MATTSTPEGAAPADAFSSPDAARAAGVAAAGGADVAVAGGPRVATAVLALINAHTAARASISGSLSAFLRQSYGGFTGWYSDQSVASLAVAAAKQVRAGQQATADLTAQYLRQVLGLYGAQLPALAKPTDLPKDGARKADPVAVYSRPAETYRWAKSTGVSDSAALEAAVERAERMAGDDLNLGLRDATTQTLEPLHEVIGYRRVLHPELSKGGSCGLCVAAATDPNRFYKSAQQMPFHSHDNCGVLPIIAGQADPGRYMNAVSLGQLYFDAAGSQNKQATTSGPALKRTRYSVDEHGELGPTLVPRQQHKPRPKPGKPTS